MSTTRAQVMAAVLAKIQAIVFSSPIMEKTTWQNTPSLQQRLALWTEVPAEQQPAVYLVTHKETDEYRGLGLLRRRLELGAWCYIRTDDQTTIGATLLDTIMEAFEAQFCVQDNSSTGQLTLGGLVYWCRIEGRVLKIPGDIDNQALMVVPIVVEMP